MRTTLKRGTGHGGQANGQIARPPGPPFSLPPPPPPLGPVSRYAAWRRRRLRLAGKILLWLLVVALVAVGALGGGIWLYLNESVAAVAPRSADVQEIQEEEILDAPLPGQPVTAIIIGYDKRAGAEGVGDVGRSDTVMLLRADPKNDTLTLLSFPRDLVVDHPGCKNHAPWRDRINTAYTYCGPSGTVKTVKAVTGIPINYALVVNFHGFKEIVNKVGGVYVDVDRRYFNDNSAGENYATINLQPGYQKLSGGPALDLARFRHTDSDLHRVARQQAFVKAFKQQVEASFSVLKLPGVIDAIVHNIEVVKGGRKATLSVDEVLGYAKFIYELPAGHFFQARLGGVTGYAELTTSSEEMSKTVREFLNPDVDAPTTATQIAQGKKPKGAAPPPDETTIVVLNGNGVEGSADSAAYLLGQRGYQANPGGNADPENDGVPNFDYFQTQVVYDPAQAGAAGAAIAVGNLFGDAEVVRAGPDVQLDSMLKVVVGQTFHGTIADAPVDDTPEHQAPAVLKSYEDVLPFLRGARNKVDFAPLAPTMRESSSGLDPEAPFRVYRLERHDALRIVFRTASGRYWGVEETSWTEAPILSGANVTRRIAGRAYQLYYDGTKLHMVAFIENGAAYWVSNTLLDELSNETMLAIAKGLEPLAEAR